MENKKGLSVLNIILLVVGVILDIYLSVTVLKNDQTALVTSIALACACCFGILYAVYGYKKDVATYALWFYGVFAIAVASKLWFLKAHDGIFLPTVVSFACLAVLAIARDLGKSKSMTLCVVNLIAAVALPVYYLMNGIDVYYVLVFVTEAILSVVLLIMMYAKYQDKASRDSK